MRYKVIYDSTRCTSQDKCRAVFALSGGGNCANNYPDQDDLINEIVELDADPGLAVVAVDTICCAYEYSSYPDEVTRLLAGMVLEGRVLAAALEPFRVVGTAARRP